MQLGGIYKGVKIKHSSLRPLKPVFIKWLSMNEQYVKKVKDGLYWYNERPTIGTISAAAWCVDGLSLEEYSSFKRRKSRYTGRSDAWILVHGRSYVIEAKQVWPSLRPRNFPRNARQWIGEAMEDLQSHEEKDGRRVALIVVVPYLKSSPANKLEKHLNSFLGIAKSLKKISLVWWFDPKHPLKDSEDEVEYQYPGVLLLIAPY